MTFKPYLIVFTLFLLIWLVPRFVLAAELLLNTDGQTAPVGQPFLVEVFLKTDQQAINAIEGELVFPGDTFTVQEVRDGNSFVNFWLSKPAVTRPGVIAFSGITPGGFAGAKGFLLAVVLQAKKVGTGEVSLDRVRLLANDGTGRVVPVITSTLVIKTVDQSGSITDPVNSLVDDIESPEIFSPIIARDQNLFNGDYFLVFATQDKNSGIDHYEVREGWWGDFKLATSPYQLQNQQLDKKVYVKAIDNVGNERVVTIKPINFTDWYQQPFYIVLVLILIVGGFFWKIVWPKFIRSF